MARSHKYTDKHHAGNAKGTAPQEHLPRFFGKNGFVDADPKKTKKNGGGKGNWGHSGDEVVDEEFHFTNARRRSNSNSFAAMKDLKTKFEVNEPEPVFEETLHGPEEEEMEQSHLTKTETASSADSSSSTQGDLHKD